MGMNNYPYRKLGDLCSILSSKRIFAKEYVEYGVPFYRSKEIIQKHNGENINTELFISEERFGEIEMRYGAPKANDMLMTSVGTLGVAYIVTDSERFYFKDGNLTWYKEFSSELSSKYLYYLFDSALGKDLIKSVTIGSSQAALTIDGMKSLEVPCPEILIQEKIVQFLSTYDSLIENNNHRIAILEEMAQKLYREWFVHFRFPGHENVKMVESEMGLMPEGWEISTIENYTTLLRRGITPKYDENSSKVVVNQKCVRDYSVDLSLARKQSKEYQPELNLQYGDVLINSTGVGTLGRVGQVFNCFIDTTVDSHVTIVRPIKNYTCYMGSYLKRFQEELMDMGVGSTNQTELNRDIIT